MPTLNCPVIVTDDVQIMNRTDDGFYIIRFKNEDGNFSVLCLPDTLILESSKGSNAGRAIELVKDFMAQKLRDEYQYLNFEN